MPPGLIGIRLIEWPLYDHPSWTCAPARRCQRGECAVEEAPWVDESVLCVSITVFFVFLS
jgi:hypothetical protein